MLNYINYYSTGPNGKPIKINETADFLFIKGETTLGDVIKRKYTIVGRKTHGQYSLVYIKKMKPNTKIAQNVFGTYVFLIQEDKNLLYALHDSVWYSSIEEAQQVSTTTDFDHKYFSVWHSPTSFKSYVKYSNLAQADKETLEKIVTSIVTGLKQNEIKLRNTHRSDIYYSKYIRESLVQNLIANHLSPMVTISEFSAKLSTFHITLPTLRSMKNTKTQIPLTTGYSTILPIISMPK